MKHALKTLVAGAFTALAFGSATLSPGEAHAFPPAPPPTPGPCPNNPGGQAYYYTFCLLAPGGSPYECYDRFESSVLACDYWSAYYTAQAGASNYTVYDGYCPACY